MSGAPGSQSPRGPSQSGQGHRASEPRGEAFATYLNTYLMVCMEAPVESQALRAFQEAFRLSAPAGFCEAVLEKISTQAPCPIEACEDIEVELSAYVDGELSPKREEQVIVHLAGCSPCMRELSELKTLAQAMPRARLKVGPAPADFAARVVAEAFSAPVEVVEDAAKAVDAPTARAPGPRFADENRPEVNNLPGRRAESRRGAGFWSSARLLSAAAGILVASLGALSFGPAFFTKPETETPKLAHSARGGAAKPSPAISKIVDAKPASDVAASPPADALDAASASFASLSTDEAVKIDSALKEAFREWGKTDSKPEAKAEVTAGEGVQGEVLVVLASADLPKLRSELLGFFKTLEERALEPSPGTPSEGKTAVAKDKGNYRHEDKSEKGKADQVASDTDRLEALKSGELIVELERSQARRLLQALEARSSLREAWLAGESRRDDQAPLAASGEPTAATPGAGVADGVGSAKPSVVEKSYDPDEDLERLAARKREESKTLLEPARPAATAPGVLRELGSPLATNPSTDPGVVSQSAAVPATLILRDGWLLSGRLIAEDEESLIFETAGQRKRFMKADILELAIGQAPLSRSLESASEAGETSQQRLRLRIQVRAR
jgi:anti-sigma factor RsiW